MPIWMPLKTEDPSTPIPVNLVTTSGSSLDPDITPATALFQARALMADTTQHRLLGILGEKRVNNKYPCHQGSATPEGRARAVRLSFRDGPSGPGPEPICGRPRLASAVQLRRVWSVAVICPAFVMRSV